MNVHIPVLLIALFFSNSCLAFSFYAHELICDVAYKISNKATQVFIDKIVENQNKGLSYDGYETFAKSCAWPDAVRKTTHKETYQYHFINVPKDKNIDLSRDCAAYDCVSQAITRYVIYLNDRSKKDEDRKEALLFLSHFVADIHQPLHVGNAEDHGGNKIKVFTSLTDKTANTNLHSIWDNDIGKKLGLHHADTAETLILVINSVETDSSWKTKDISSWAIQSFEQARTVSYKFPDGTLVVKGSRLTDDYYNAAKPVLLSNVMKAAVRLAFLLELAAGEQSLKGTFK